MSSISNPTPFPRRRTMPLNADSADALMRHWQGNEAVGWEIVKAFQHATALYENLYKGETGDSYVCVKQIFDSASDPASSPDDAEVVDAWAKLPDAIYAANAACYRILLNYSPSITHPTTIPL